MLKGKKVVLRALAREDLPRIYEFHNDLEIEYLRRSEAPQPQSLARLQEHFDARAADGERDGTWFVMVVEGVVIGECGLSDLHPSSRHCSIGIAIGDRSYWGRGFGRDAIRVLLRYAFLHHNMRRVWLTVTADNERAIRAYRGCGFQEEGRLRQHEWCNGRYVDLVQMGILREEWDPDGT